MIFAFNVIKHWEEIEEGKNHEKRSFAAIASRRGRGGIVANIPGHLLDGDPKRRRDKHPESLGLRFEVGDRQFEDVACFPNGIALVLAEGVR